MTTRDMTLTCRVRGTEGRTGTVRFWVQAESQAHALELIAAGQIDDWTDWTGLGDDEEAAEVLEVLKVSVAL